MSSFWDRLSTSWTSWGDNKGSEGKGKATTSLSRRFGRSIASTRWGGWGLDRWSYQASRTQDEDMDIREEASRPSSYANRKFIRGMSKKYRIPHAIDYITYESNRSLEAKTGFCGGGLYAKEALEALGSYLAFEMGQLTHPVLGQDAITNAPNDWFPELNRANGAIPAVSLHTHSEEVKEDFYPAADALAERVIVEGWTTETIAEFVRVAHLLPDPDYPDQSCFCPDAYIDGGRRQPTAPCYFDNYEAAAPEDLKAALRGDVADAGEDDAPDEDPPSHMASDPGTREKLEDKRRRRIASATPEQHQKIEDALRVLLRLAQPTFKSRREESGARIDVRRLPATMTGKNQRPFLRHKRIEPDVLNFVVMYDISGSVSGEVSEAALSIILLKEGLKRLGADRIIKFRFGFYFGIGAIPKNEEQAEMAALSLSGTALDCGFRVSENNKMDNYIRWVYSHTDTECPMGPSVREVLATMKGKRLAVVCGDGALYNKGTIEFGSLFDHWAVANYGEGTSRMMRRSIPSLVGGGCGIHSGYYPIGMGEDVYCTLTDDAAKASPIDVLTDAIMSLALTVEGNPPPETPYRCLPKLNHRNFDGRGLNAGAFTSEIYERAMTDQDAAWW